MAWARAAATAANAAAAAMTAPATAVADDGRCHPSRRVACAVAATAGNGRAAGALQAAARAAAAGGALGEEGKDDRGHYAVHTTAHAAHGSD